MSARTDIGTSPASRGARALMLTSAIVEMPNDAASNANAVPTPTASMSRPPSAGPASRSATGRTNWSSEFARASSEAGRTSGTIASKAGPKNAAPAPYSATRATTCHSSSMPVIDRTAMAADRQAARDVGGEHHAAPVEAVGDHAAEQQERDRRDRHRDADERERGRRVRQRVDLPRHRDEEDAVAHEGDAHATPEEPEVAVAKGGEHADAAEAAGAVEALVAMVHRRAGARRGSPAPARPVLRGQELDDTLGVHGAGEVEALTLVAAEVAQGRPLLGELDALRDDLEVQRLAQRHDGGREAGRLRRGVVA